jgi:hypothetical protein
MTVAMRSLPLRAVGGLLAGAMVLWVPRAVGADEVGGPVGAHEVGGSGEAAGDPRVLLHQLEQDAAHRTLLADALTETRDALERAHRFHILRDEGHARDAEALALEWAEMGRDLVRASDAEERAAQVRRKATDGQVQLDRTRALVEETVARLGRLRAEIAEMEAPSPTGHVRDASDAGLPLARAPEATDAGPTAAPKATPHEARP